MENFIAILLKSFFFFSSLLGSIGDYPVES